MNKYKVHKTEYENSTQTEYWYCLENDQRVECQYMAEEHNWWNYCPICGVKLEDVKDETR